MAKRIITAILALSLACSLFACGDDNESSSRKSKKAKSESSSAAADKNTDSESSSDESTPDRPLSTEKAVTLEGAAHKTVGENGAKAVKEVYLYSPYKDTQGLVDFEDLFGRHVLHSRVVGLVGAPIDVEFDVNDIPGGKLVFCIDKNELHGVRPDALMFMWYDEENDNYVESSHTMIESDEGDELRVSLEIDKPGVYLLVNKYTWLNVWGAGLDDDGLEEGYEPTIDDLMSASEWQANENTGDILSLIDNEYIQNSMQDGGAEFVVNTPEQLASVCYYINCFKAEPNTKPVIYISIESDIDLNGIKWAPMGWSGAGIDHRFSAVLNGNNHTIKNLKVDYHGNAGLIGNALNATIYDLKVENADIDGYSCGVLMGSDLNSKVSNVECTGKVKGDKAGSIAGDATETTFTDCKADVKVNGKKFFDEYFSFYEYDKARVAAEHGKPETLTVKGTKVIREAGLEDKYHNITWKISTGLQRNAKNETEYDLAKNGKGLYTVELLAYVDGYYIPISEPVTVTVG